MYVLMLLRLYDLGFRRLTDMTWGQSLTKELNTMVKDKRTSSPDLQTCDCTGFQRGKGMHNFWLQIFPVAYALLFLESKWSNDHQMKIDLKKLQSTMPTIWYILFYKVKKIINISKNATGSHVNIFSSWEWQLNKNVLSQNSHMECRAHIFCFRRDIIIRNIGHCLNDEWIVNAYLPCVLEELKLFELRVLI